MTDIVIKYQEGTMTIYLEEFLSRRSISKVRKLLKLINQYGDGSEVQKILNIIEQFNKNERLHIFYEKCLIVMQG